MALVFLLRDLLGILVFYGPRTKADEKEFFIASDPGAQVIRKRDMLTNVEYAPKPEPAMLSQTGLASAAAKGKGTGRLFVKTKVNTARYQWVEQVARICDHQDQTAFAELFSHFAPRVKAFLMKSGADASMAEECAQEVMATLWHKAHMFDPSRASVATWVFTIARNRKIDALRKQRRPEPEDLTWGPEAEPDQEDVLTLQQESEKLGRAMAELPTAQRELIERAYFGDLSHTEIAAETGLPLGTIKSRIRLALERLRHSMK